MNRFKLVFILIVLGFVGILAIQNQQLLFLKILCPDVADSSCWYQTPSLPLAVWMLVFAIAGILSSLIWQFLIQIRSSSKTSSSPKNYYTDRPFDTPQGEYTRPKAEVANKRKSTNTVSDWEKASSENWEREDTKSSVPRKTVNNYAPKAKPQSPPNINLSDSADSDKFRETSTKKREKLENKSSNKIDDVYDATYRTVGSSPLPNSSKIEDDDEEWI